jgi:hypothetical protein
VLELEEEQWLAQFKIQYQGGKRTKSLAKKPGKYERRNKILKTGRQRKRNIFFPLMGPPKGTQAWQVEEEF